MEYVRYKLDKSWHGSVKVIKNGYYMFPYFVSDDYDMFKCFIGENSPWKHRFQVIKPSTFFKKTGLNEETCLLIKELLEPCLDKYGLSDNVQDKSNLIIIKQILKKYNYGKKVLNPKKIKKCLQKKT